MNHTIPFEDLAGLRQTVNPLEHNNNMDDLRHQLYEKYNKAPGDYSLILLKAGHRLVTFADVVAVVPDVHQVLFNDPVYAIFRPLQPVDMQYGGNTDKIVTAPRAVRSVKKLVKSSPKKLVKKPVKKLVKKSVKRSPKKLVKKSPKKLVKKSPKKSVKKSIL